MLPPFLLSHAKGEPIMKERLTKLLSVKSIVTLVLTAVFAFLSITGRISAENFMTVFTVIVAFYFGTQAEKKNGGAV